jgi:hypothetical protein
LIKNFVGILQGSVWVYLSCLVAVCFFDDRN